MYKLQLMLMALILVGVGTVSAIHQDKMSVSERTMPTGKVYRQGDDAPVAKATPISASRNGEQVYTEKCSMCHTAGVAGAPKTGEASAWNARIAQGEEILFEHALKGYQGNAGFMPAKGGCTDCSDEEVKAAVRYLLAQLK